MTNDRIHPTGDQDDTAALSGSVDEASDTHEETAGTFLESLPEEIRGHAALEGIDNPDALVRAYIALSEGGARRPESPDAYEIQSPEGMPEDEGMLRWYRDAAFELGLSQEQDKTLADRWNAYAGERLSAQRRAQEEELDALRRDWGDRFSEHVERGVRIVDQVEREVSGFKDWLDRTRLGDAPMFLRAFARLGAIVSEDSLVEGRSMGPNEGPKRINGIPMLSFPSMGDREG